VKVGNWYRIDRGLFRITEWVPEQHDELCRWSLWSDQDAVVSHESAMAVHEIGEFESPRVHLTVPASFSKDDEAVVLHRADLPDVDILDHGGFRVTTVTRSLIDVAAAGANGDQLARAIQEARQRGLLTLSRLRARAEAVDLKGALHIERAIQGLRAQ
jgi:predicted transcriptional regulator of viral defense system